MSSSAAGSGCVLGKRVLADAFRWGRKPVNMLAKCEVAPEGSPGEKCPAASLELQRTFPRRRVQARFRTVTWQRLPKHTSGSHRPGDLRGP